MDRHTDRPGGSDGASPIVVTSRPNEDDLVVDDDVTLEGTATANGAARSGDGAGVPAATDHAAHNGLDGDGTGVPDTVADTVVVPALPADSIGLPRGSQPKMPFAFDQQSFALDDDSSDVEEPLAVEPDDGPMGFSFDRPVSPPIAPAAADWAAAADG